MEMNEKPTLGVGPLRAFALWLALSCVALVGLPVAVAFGLHLACEIHAGFSDGCRK